MKANGFSGTTNIRSKGIKKHFTRWKNEPIQAIIELIANGFDAKADLVNVRIEFNGIDGLEYVSVADNGAGIDINKGDEHFDLFNESLKRDDDDVQGSHGRGRLAFHLLSNNATWYTRCNGEDAKIDIDSTNLHHYEVRPLEANQQHAFLADHSSGTCVELKGFICNLPEQESIISKLQNEFGWRLALNSNRKLLLNGNEITIPDNELIEKIVEIEGYTFQIKLIHWLNKPGSEKSYNYLLDDTGHIVCRELSTFNKKPNFYLSSYTTSKWVDNFDKNGAGLAFENDYDANPSSSVYRKLQKNISIFGKEIFEDFQRRLVDEQIEKYDSKGYFPKYAGVREEDAIWRKDNTKRVIKEIYLAEPAVFTNLGAKQTKIIIGLLDRLLISNENDSLCDILQHVMDLDSEKISVLADQLTRTTLENVVSTIETLQKREIAVHKLQDLMERHYKEVLETPDLQIIIENNTWLFGDHYTIIGAEEDDFQKTALNLREKIKGINDIEEGDVDQVDLSEGLNVEGVRRQVDLFLARQAMKYDDINKKYYKCTIIEIKKPSISLNKKHLNQLTDYADIILQHPGFQSENFKFDLILVGRKVSEKDTSIKSALETAKNHNESGLVQIYDNVRIKCYVKTWATIFSDFNLSNGYLLENLKTKRTKLEERTTKEAVTDLQKLTH